MDMLLYKLSKKRHFLYLLLDQPLSRTDAKVTSSVLGFALHIRKLIFTTNFADIYALLKATGALVLNDKCLS